MFLKRYRWIRYKLSCQSYLKRASSIAGRRLRVKWATALDFGGSSELRFSSGSPHISSIRYYRFTCTISISRYRFFDEEISTRLKTNKKPAIFRPFVALDRKTTPKLLRRYPHDGGFKLRFEREPFVPVEPEIFRPRRWKPPRPRARSSPRRPRRTGSWIEEYQRRAHLAGRA